MKDTVLADSNKLQINNEIRIGFYEDWMFDQVIDMFVAQYGFDPDRQRAIFRKFYESPFQIKEGVRLVAMDGETVCGFQSYFYWPYHYQGKTLRTFQSGNSLVSPHYRGRKIFARLLNFLSETDTQNRPEINFLMGFPVEMSYGGFMRNKWANPLDLVWYARPIHPFSFIRTYEPKASDWTFETTSEFIDVYYPKKQFILSRGVEFTKWRADCHKVIPNYLYFHYHNSSGTIRFDLKPNQRGHLNELVIGNITRDSPNPELLEDGLKALIRVANEHRFLTFLSIALNPESQDKDLLNVVRRYYFFKLKNKIPFIVKPIDDSLDCLKPTLWSLLRSDVDTW